MVVRWCEIWVESVLWDFYWFGFFSSSYEILDLSVPLDPMMCDSLIVRFCLMKFRDQKSFSGLLENTLHALFLLMTSILLKKKRTTTISTISKATLNQLVVELDGFKKNDGVLVIGATIFSEVLDEGLVRDGYLTSIFLFLNQVLKGRNDVLELYMSKLFLTFSFLFI